MREEIGISICLHPKSFVDECFGRFKFSLCCQEALILIDARSLDSSSLDGNHIKVLKLSCLGKDFMPLKGEWLLTS